MLVNQNRPIQDNHSALSNAILKATSIGAAAALLLPGCGRFNDTPGASEDNFGRTVNGFSTLLTGVLAQQLETNANINVVINKPGWADAKITGSTTSTSIVSQADLSLSSCSFNATGSLHKMTGDIEKSEFDWKAVQTGPGTWKIERFGLKMNYTLTLSTDHGRIQGLLQRPATWDWKISGTYIDGLLKVKINTGITEPNFEISGSLLK